MIRRLSAAHAAAMAAAMTVVLVATCPTAYALTAPPTAPPATVRPPTVVGKPTVAPTLAPPGRNCAVAGADIAQLPAPQTRLAADLAWPTTRGDGVLVAVLDSGVDRTTPQLAGRVLAGKDVAAGAKDAAGDCLGQGTAMAGLVAASVVPGIGFHGVAPAVRIFPVRVTADSLQTTPDVLALGINAAVAAGASVVLATVGTPIDSPALTTALAAAETAGVVVVAPAEAASEEGGGWLAPGVYESVLAVASVDADGSADDPDEALVPIADVAAPGVGVVATSPGGGHTDGFTGVRPAAAYVAGVVALVCAAYPDLTPAQVRRRVELTADHPGRAVPDVAVGWGVVSPLAAVTAVIPDELSTSTPTASAVVVPPPTPPIEPDRTDLNRALWLFGTGAAVGIALLIARYVVPRGRSRRWRPGRKPASTEVGVR